MKDYFQDLSVPGPIAELLNGLQKPVRRPPICESCGTNRSDPPSRLCPGCQAYQEHQR